MAQATRSAAPTSSSGRYSDDPIENASDWFQANLKPIGIVLGSIAVVALLILGYRWMEADKREDASTALGLAQNPLAAGNLPQADTALARVVDRYEGTSAGQQAALLLAQVRYEKQEYASGIAALEKALGSASDEFRPQFHELIAMGYEAQNQHEKAAEAYAKASDAARFDVSKGEFKAAQARALGAAGKHDQAKPIWQDLADRETWGFASEARIRLGELAGAGAAGGSSDATTTTPK